MATENKPPKAKPTNPTYFVMAKTAIESLGDKKGSSVQAITAFIADKYSIETDVVKQHLKPALAKGIENATFVRPKDAADAKGFTGRFKLNKVKATEEAKEQAKKEKAKLAKEKAKEKSKEKTAVKKATGAKSPKKKVAKPKAAAKKSPSKTKAKKITAVAEKKPKAAKATLKTPLKTPKKLKTKVAKTGSATKKSAKK